METFAGDVTAPFDYLGDPPTDDPATPIIYDAIGRVGTTMRVNPTPMPIVDGRTQAGGFSLDREGFTLVPHHCGITDFLDRAQTDTLYPLEAVALIRELTGAYAATAIGTNVRFGNPRDDYAATSDHKPARFPHADFTDEGASTMHTLGDQEPGAFSRYAIYNLWRVFSDPPQDFPLAVCDARTVSTTKEDEVQIVLDVPGRDPIRAKAQGYYPDANNRWVYFSNMTVDEVLVFKGYDSDPKRPRRVPHTSFVNPLAPPGIPSRSSIETRVIAFYR